MLRKGVPISKEEFDEILKDILIDVSAFYRSEILPMLNLKQEDREKTEKNKGSQVPQRGQGTLSQSSVGDNVYIPVKTIPFTISDRKKLQLLEDILADFVKKCIEHAREKMAEQADMEKSEMILREGIKNWRKKMENVAFDIKIHDLNNNIIRTINIGEQNQKNEETKSVKSKMKSSKVDAKPHKS